MNTADSYGIRIQGKKYVYRYINGKWQHNQSSLVTMLYLVNDEKKLKAAQRAEGILYGLNKGWYPPEAISDINRAVAGLHESGTHTNLALLTEHRLAVSWILADCGEWETLEQAWGNYSARMNGADVTALPTGYAAIPQDPYAQKQLLSFLKLMTKSRTSISGKCNTRTVTAIDVIAKQLAVSTAKTYARKYPDQQIREALVSLPDGLSVLLKNTTDRAYIAYTIHAEIDRVESGDYIIGKNATVRELQSKSSVRYAATRAVLRDISTVEDLVSLLKAWSRSEDLLPVLLDNIIQISPATYNPLLWGKFKDPAVKQALSRYVHRLLDEYALVEQELESTERPTDPVFEKIKSGICANYLGVHDVLESTVVERLWKLLCRKLGEEQMMASESYIVKKYAVTPSLPMDGTAQMLASLSQKIRRQLCTRDDLPASVIKIILSFGDSCAALSSSKSHLPEDVLQVLLKRRSRTVQANLKKRPTILASAP